MDTETKAVRDGAETADRILRMILTDACPGVTGDAFGLALKLGRGAAEAAVRRVLSDACEPWSYSTGGPPDDDSPLAGVFVAGMLYDEALLAKLLKVEHYEGGDGSEDFDNDATTTLRNILTGAGLYDPEDGRWASRATPSAAGGGAIPEGWALVPLEATGAMWQAGQDADAHPTDSYSAVWDAMIAADLSVPSTDRGDVSIAAADGDTSPAAPQGADLAGLSAAVEAVFLARAQEADAHAWAEQTLGDLQRLTSGASATPDRVKGALQINREANEEIMRTVVVRQCADEALREATFTAYHSGVLTHPGSVAPTSGERDHETAALRDVLAERRRQIEAEGWTPEHDDNHSRGEMALAAACYAIWAALRPRGAGSENRARGVVTQWWPWSWQWWKPTDPRRDLVKAGALILADIERLDRAAPPLAPRNEGERP